MSNNDPFNNSSSPKIYREFVYRSNGADVGQSRETRREDVKNPISIAFPLAISDRFGLFDMREDLLSTVKDQLKSILLTNKGERVCNFDFGASIRDIIFNQYTEDVDSVLIESIQTNVSKFMPFVTLSSFSLYSSDEIDSLNPNEFLIELSFSVNGINTSESLSLVLSR